MRISFFLPLCAPAEDLTLRRRHSRFTSAWRRGNTESMSVLWNVLSCRAASFPIFRSTLSSASFAIFAPELSFPIFSPLFLFASSRRPFFPYVPLRLHLLENDIYFFKLVCVCGSGLGVFSECETYVEFFWKNKFRLPDVLYMISMWWYQ